MKISSSPFSWSLLLSNTNVTSSTHSMHNILKRFPELKDFGLWLTILPVERGELLCLDNVAFVRPSLVHYFSNLSANAMMRNMNITGSMMYPCLTPTLKGMEVSIFPIISLTTLF